MQENFYNGWWSVVELDFFYDFGICVISSIQYVTAHMDLESHLSWDETHEPKAIDFFAYKRNIASLMDQYREWEWFVDQAQMKEFLYNEHQENPDGVIMEVNTGNVWWPWMLEIVDRADIAYMKAFPNTPYSQFMGELHRVNLYENDERYLEKYILSELKDKNAEKIILLFGSDAEHPPRTVEDIWLSNDYARYVSLKDLRKIIKMGKEQLGTTLLMQYWFSQTYRPRKNFQQFQKIFQNRYINKENTVFMSKQWPTLLWWESLTWPYLTKSTIDEQYGNVVLQAWWLCQQMEQSYVLKQPFIDQGKWICFPGERNFFPWNTIKVKHQENNILNYYALQRFHELPRKVSLDSGGIIVPKTVDVRAFVTFDAEKQDIDIQIFGREWQVWSVSNVSSGWKFTKIYTVKDDIYYDMQSRLHSLIPQLWTSQTNQLQSYFDMYAKENLKLLPNAKISPIPFILSTTWCKRVFNIVYKLVNNMIQEWFISQNKEGQMVGDTIIGVDLSINPLPEK